MKTDNSNKSTPANQKNSSPQAATAPPQKKASTSDKATTNSTPNKVTPAKDPPQQPTLLDATYPSQTQNKGMKTLAGAMKSLTPAQQASAKRGFLKLKGSSTEDCLIPNAHAQD